MRPVETRFGWSSFALAASVVPCVLAVLTMPVYVAFGGLLPFGLAGSALFHSFRALRLRTVSTSEAEDAAEKAFHFSVFSLSLTGMVVVVVSLAHAVVSGD